MTAPLLRLDALAVTHAGAGRPALADVGLEIDAGERLAIIGESGSGKSTLARAVAGLLPPGARLGGRIDWPALGRVPTPGAELAYVFQDPGESLDPVMAVGTQVAEGARRHLGLGRRAAEVRAVELLGEMGLTDPPRLARAYPHQLSGGQRQRVALAAALVTGPSILIADEVTSALDAAVQAEIVRLIGKRVRRDRMTLIFITHDMALAAGLADRIAVIDRGRLVEIGPADRLIAAPASAAAARLVAAHIDLETPPLVGRAP
jgi:peptide/nickel transport system ATP-binding protein